MIDKFENEYAFLSNFYEKDITLYGITYRNAEAAFQAQKTFDLDIKSNFQTLNASLAKYLGKRIKLRSDWEDVKNEVMEYVIRAKFSDPELRDMLINTGDQEIIEGNTWNDTYWGMCRGKGHNQLGKTLMKIRKELIGVDYE